MALLTMPGQLAKAALHTAALSGGGAVTLGILLALATGDPGDVLVPIHFVLDIVRWAFIIGSIVWTPALLTTPFLLLLALWNTGRKQQAAPQWALPADQREPESREVVPDESAILKALRHLGIGPLNQALKQGWQPRWMAPTTRLGKGWHTQLQLPMGVTVKSKGNKKQVLAHNLLRKPVEVWPTEPHGQPGVLDLWVADQGSLSGEVPAWPLLTDGTSDYFKGVPAGISQRGEPVRMGKLMAANYMVGGIMGVGKSSLVVALLLGAMLDPLVEIEVYVMAYNVDYDPMRPRLATLVKGDEDEQVEAALKALRNLRDEVTERGKLLDELGGDEVRLTRDLAEKDARMRPKVVVFDECHELFEHKKYGQEAAELAVKVLKKARKVGITLMFVTVSPTATSIPKDVTRNTSPPCGVRRGRPRRQRRVAGHREAQGGHHRDHAQPGRGHRHRADLRLHQEPVRADPLLLRPQGRQQRPGHPRRSAGRCPARWHHGGPGTAGGQTGRPPDRHRRGARPGAAAAHAGGHPASRGAQPHRVPRLDLRRPDPGPGRGRGGPAEVRRGHARQPCPGPRSARRTCRGHRRRTRRVMGRRLGAWGVLPNRLPTPASPI